MWAHRLLATSIQVSSFHYCLCMRLDMMHRSESPSQVFVAVVQWLYETLKCVPEEEWKDIVLAYDAMCKLDGLKVSQQPLPLPEPYNKI